MAWAREGRAGCLGHLPSFTALSGLMLVCIHNLGPDQEGVIQKWNRNYSLIKLKTAPVSPSWQTAQHNINIRLFLNDHLVFACSHPVTKQTVKWNLWWLFYNKWIEDRFLTWQPSHLTDLLHRLSLSSNLSKHSQTGHLIVCLACLACLLLCVLAS